MFRRTHSKVEALTTNYLIVTNATVEDIAKHGRWYRANYLGKPLGTLATDIIFRRIDQTDCGNFERFDFSTTKLDGQELSMAKFAGAKIRSAPNAKLRGAVLEAIDGQSADFKKSDLANASLKGAFLWGADFRDADLTGADFSEAKIHRANFSNANLRDTKGLMFDECDIRSARFSASPNDGWSIIRREYSGSMFAFHLIFLLIFLGTYAAKAFFWVGVNQAQIGLVETQTQLVSKLKQMQHPRDLKFEKGEELQKALSSLDASRFQQIVNSAKEEVQANVLGAQYEIWREYIEGFEKLQPCLRPACQPPQPIWKVLLRIEGGSPKGPVPHGATALAIALLLYNVIRAVLTRQVSRLREAEERSGYTPRYLEYYWMHGLHRYFMIPLGFIAIAALIYNGYLVLVDTTVILPT